MPPIPLLASLQDGSRRPLSVMQTSALWCLAPVTASTSMHSIMHAYALCTHEIG